MTLVSCLCPTYNRAPHSLWLVEEAVDSFLRQDYAGPAELVVLNDTPGQQLVFQGDARPTPGPRRVRVVNCPFRFPTLGRKRNQLAELAEGDVLLPWDDDDVHLPWRVSQAVWFLAGPQAREGYWKPPQVWFSQYGPDLAGGPPVPRVPPLWRHNVGVRHQAGACTRAAFARAGGYPDQTLGEDAVLDGRLGGASLPSFPAGIPAALWAYVYRWGVSPCHVSGYGTEAGYGTVGQRPLTPGSFALRPHWRADYVAVTRAQL